MPRLISSNNDEETIVEACWAVEYYIAVKGDKSERIKYVVSLGLFDRVLEILASDDDQCTSPLMRIICNATYCDESVVNMLYRENLVDILYTLSMVENSRTRIDALWAMNNLICTSQKIADDFFMFQVVTKLIDILDRELVERVKVEALGVLLAFVNTKSAVIIEKLVSGYNIIDVCMEMLKDEGVELVDTALDILAAILDYGNDLNSDRNQVVGYILNNFGVEPFVDLQSREYEHIYKKVASLLNEFFSEHVE